MKKLKDSNGSIEAPEALFIELLQCQVLMRKWVTAQLLPVNITVTEYHALRFIQNRTRVAASTLQESFGSTAATIAQLIATLEKKQLITRTPSVDDKRIQYIALTPNGLKKVSQAQQIMKSAVDALQLPKTTVENAVAALHIIRTSISTSS